MRKQLFNFQGLAFLILASAASSGAATLFSDAFDVDSSAGYRVLKFSAERDSVDFAFDYGALGIPAAPNSLGGSATGVRMAANNPVVGTTAVGSAVQIIPMGLGSNLVDIDYRLTYDLWMNVNGPLPGGGGGSTEAFMVGVGWNGATAIEIGQDNGTYMTITGDGGSSSDVRTFTNDGFNFLGINAGPSNNTSDPYYLSVFPGEIDVSLLPVQGGIDGQTGITSPGQMAFAWHEVRVDVVGNSASFYVDDLLIAADANADRAGSIMLGYGDYFSSESDAPQWSFGIVDNLRVNSIPEPSTALLLVFFAVPAALRRRR
ncbi:MAG: hypothetical protein ACI9R3_002803 [Verrucomicrobiales bacterium]|jgi:hypothetical protein